MVNTTCDSTLEDLKIVSEVPIVGDLNFHQLGIIIAAACTLIAVLLSFYLIFMHALHYTKPYEQRHIIRILFMIPVYAAASLLSFLYYWHAIYFQVISDCYEAFAIASFFALLCHYVAPNLHDQKNYFRGIYPVKGWVWPLSWWKCCGGRERGPFRTPRSGLTWFNIIWTGIYQYCFIRVAMTITAVITQYFDKYCESSDSPVFAHIWILVIEGIAVTIAMFCLIQFYIQMRHDLTNHSPFLKVLAIKLVIFLSFWQSFGISVLTGPTFNVIKATPKLAYPDISVGIPSLLVCIEMAIFAILHIFAYPYKPYTSRAQAMPYPVPANASYEPGYNENGPNVGGPLGIRALLDAMNPWDLITAFARGMRWLFVGVKHREGDSSYKNPTISLSPSASTAYKPTSDESTLPIATEFRRSRFGPPKATDQDGSTEAAGLIAHAQPNPGRGDSPPRTYTPARLRYDPVTGQEISAEGRAYDSSANIGDIGVATPYTGAGIATPYSQDYTETPVSQTGYAPHTDYVLSRPPQQGYGEHSQPSQEASAAHNLLWGQPSQRETNAGDDQNTHDQSFAARVQRQQQQSGHHGYGNEI